MDPLELLLNASILLTKPLLCEFIGDT
jgi:hypothetical protein